MRSAELIACGIDGALGERLEAWARERQWRFRAVSGPDVLLGLLRHGSRGAAFVRLGRHLVREVEALHAAATGFADVALVPIVDGAPADLESLLGELGVRAPVFAPRDGEAALAWLTAWADARRPPRPN